MKITERVRNRKSSLQTRLRCPRSQVRKHPSRATSFRHLVLLFKSKSIRQPYSQADLLSDHTLPLAYLQLRSHMGWPSGLTLPPDCRKCLLLVIRPYRIVASPPFLSTSKLVQTSDRAVDMFSAVIKKFKATSLGDEMQHKR